MKKYSTLINLLWVLLSALLITALVTPAAGSMIASYLDGYILNLNTVFSYYSKLPDSYFAYFAQLGEGSQAIGFLATFIFSCIFIGLYALETNFSNKDREVKNGILASEEICTSSKDIKKGNLLWKPGTTPEQPGIVYGYIDGRYVYENPIHSAIFGASGSLKSRASALPSIILNAEVGASLLVTDIKLELYAYTRKFLKNKGYRVLLLDADNVKRGIRLNLLDVINQNYKSGHLAKCEDRTRELASSLIPDSGGENAIFERGAAGVLAAVIWLIASSKEVPDNEKHLWSVIKTILEGCKDGTDDLKQWILSFGADNPAVSMAATFISAEGKLEAGILSELHSSLMPFTSQSMRWLLSGNDLNISKAIHEKVAIFLHILPEGPYNKVFTSFLNQWWDETLRSTDLGNPARECVVIADEFGNLPKLNSLPTITKLARSYRLHFNMYLQSIEALSKFKENNYDGASEIIANTSLRVLLTAGDKPTAEHFHMLGGQRTVLSQNSGESKNSHNEGSSLGYSETTVDNWPIASIMGRNPIEDGALIWKKKEPSAPERAGKFEIPVIDPSVGLKEILPTVGTKSHESGVIQAEMLRLHSISQDRNTNISVWTPDFFERNQDRDQESEEDLFGI